MNQLSDPWCHSQMEILPSLVNVDDTQKASSVGYISVDVAICFRELLYAHLHYFISCWGILRSVLKERNKRQPFLAHGWAKS